ncbi:MAG: tetratricopeptide repeat protein, partial [Woeseia sp.]
MFKKLFLELRRREVFRTAGLYIGIAWITIEVASVLLPAFDMPDAALQWLVYLAVAGFPISLVLAWIFDISDKGIVVQEDTDESVALPVGGYKMDFVVIGVLTVALIISVYQNFTAAPDVGEAAAPKTVLLAGIDNDSASPGLEETLAQALIMGLETTPSISLQNLLDRELQMAAAGASVAAGQAVPAMAPQDAQIVISGSVTKDGGGLRIRLRAVDQASDEIIFEEDAGAANETELLPALDELLAELRASVGDTPDASAPAFSGERAITQSFAALQSFSAAEALMRNHDYPAALQQYQRATELDPQFARAWYGAAFAASAAGQGSVARELWQQADKLQARIDPAILISLRARYFTTLQPDYAKAIAQYEQLVTLLPANGAALQSLARLYRATGQQDKAFARNSALLALSPQSLSLRTSNAEYALYSNEFELA